MNRLIFLVFITLASLGLVRPAAADPITGDQLYSSGAELGIEPGSVDYVGSTFDSGNQYFAAVSPDELSISKQSKTFGPSYYFGSIASVPEPATWLLMSLGLMGMVALRRGQQRRSHLPLKH